MKLSMVIKRVTFFTTFAFCVALGGYGAKLDRSDLKETVIAGCVWTYTVHEDSVTILKWGRDGNTQISNTITIPSALDGKSVRGVGNDAFKDCLELTNITIPDSVTSIGSSAFAGCGSLTNVTIPDSVTSIGSSAFAGCGSLTNVTIPDSVTSIKEKTFILSGLESVTIPNGVTSIGDMAFYGCPLTSVTIPNSVTSIGAGAFAECRFLESITIPCGEVNVEKSAFDSTTKVIRGEGNKSPLDKTPSEKALSSELIWGFWGVIVFFVLMIIGGRGTMKYWIKCWKKCAVFSGRARRGEYWSFGLITCAIALGLEFSVSIVGVIAVYMGGVFSIVAILPGLAVSVRRLHDIGKSGSKLLSPIILGMIGLILGVLGTKVSDKAFSSILSAFGIAFLIGGAIVYFFVCLAMMVRDSEKRANAYGPSPKYETENGLNP